jgi:hypothetical protein
LTIRNSKLTRTNRLHVDWSATVPCNTACSTVALTSFGGTNVVVGKNYRLQNIQLSKISSGASPPNPHARRSRCPDAPLASSLGDPLQRLAEAICFR